MDKNLTSQDINLFIVTTINYSKIYSDFVKDLSSRAKEVFSRRFGVKGKERETLDSIGQGFGITRERVRQIEEWGFSHIKKQNQPVLEKISKDFTDYFEKKGGFKREDIVLKDLGGESFQPYVLFLLNLSGNFLRVCEKKDFHSFWTTKPEQVKMVKKNLDLLVDGLKKEGRPLIKDYFYSNASSQYNLSPEVVLSYLEVSKRIKENKEGKIGLVEWPEINPRGVKDKAFLVFKKENRPLHFTEVATLISKLDYNLSGKKALPQTVHNELIKDSRFVLVGRGKYALSEWGYLPGTVKEMISQVLKENKEPVERERIVEKVLSQRLVAKNTVLMNLNNKRYFFKTPEGKYTLRKTQTA